MSYQILAAFPAVGKSHFARNNPDVYDMDDKEHADHRAAFTNMEGFVKSYASAIEARVAAGQSVLISSHHLLTLELAQRGNRLLLVYPERVCKQEYVQRVIDRDKRDDDQSIAYQYGQHWDVWMDMAENRADIATLRVGPGKFLSDVVGVQNGQFVILE